MKKVDRRRFKMPGIATYTKLYNECKRFALARNLEFCLSKDQWISLVSKNCIYCNAEPIPKSMYCNKENKARRPDRTTEETIKRSWVNINGIDRVNNNEGYILNNCEACCTDCNMSKKGRTVSEFLSHVARISDFQFLKKENT